MGAADERVEREGVPVLVDLACGGAAGLVYTVVSHPFDTVKVALQTAPAGRFATSWAATRHVMARPYLGTIRGFRPGPVGRRLPPHRCRCCCGCHHHHHHHHHHHKMVPGTPITTAHVLTPQARPPPPPRPPPRPAPRPPDYDNG